MPSTDSKLGGLTRVTSAPPSPGWPEVATTPGAWHLPLDSSTCRVRPHGIITLQRNPLLPGFNNNHQGWAVNFHRMVQVTSKDHVKFRQGLSDVQMRGESFGQTERFTNRSLLVQFQIDNDQISGFIIICSISNYSTLFDYKLN